MGQHFLIDHTGAHGAGDGLSIHGNAARAVAFLKNADSGVVAFGVEEKLSRCPDGRF